MHQPSAPHHPSPPLRVPSLPPLPTRLRSKPPLPSGSPRSHLIPQGSLLTPINSRAPEQGVQGYPMLQDPSLSSFISCLFLQLPWTPTTLSFCELVIWAIPSPSAHSLALPTNLCPAEWSWCVSSRPSQRAPCHFHRSPGTSAL